MNIEEGMLCPICSKGRMAFVPNGECSCHIVTPCNACVQSYLKCSGCGITEDELQERIVLPMKLIFAFIDRAEDRYEVVVMSKSTWDAEHKFEEGFSEDNGELDDLRKAVTQLPLGEITENSYDFITKDSCDVVKAKFALAGIEFNDAFQQWMNEHRI